MSSPGYTPPKTVPVPVAGTREPDTRVDYLNVNFGVKSWLFTTDHKRIAILYLIVITLMFFLGGAFAVLVRLELATPDRRPHGRRHLQQDVHACTASSWCSSS